MPLAIRRVKETQYGMEITGTCLILVYAGDINILGENINTMRSTVTG
jgi:hypothetical protein